MNPIRFTVLTTLASLLAASGGSLFGQGTGISYQGRLDDGSSPANGSYDLRFTLFSASSGGGAIGLPITNSAVNVSNGLFSVTLDFGSGAFNGADRWLEIGARNNGGGAFTTLSPRQPVTSAPYAILARGASNLLGTVSSSQLSGVYANPLTFSSPANSFSGNGTGLTALNASQLNNGTIPDARLAANVARVNQVWSLDGNAGTSAGAQFLGTTDNQPLELKINNIRALRLEPTAGAPNFLGGDAANAIVGGVQGATVGGGSGNTIALNSHRATISGGLANDIGTNSPNSAIGGGNANNIGIGSANSTIAGGFQNNIGNNSDRGAIGGGAVNGIAANSFYGTIAGGADNNIGINSDYSAIGGGLDNNVAAGWSTIAGGNNNNIATNALNSAISGGRENFIGAASTYGTIAGGWQNTIDTSSAFATIVGGFLNTLGTNCNGSTVGGGQSNDIGTNSPYSTVGGGTNNNIAGASSYSTIGGGQNNDIGTNAAGSIIGGGVNNNIGNASPRSTITGGALNDIGTNSPYSAIGGGTNNNIAAHSRYATIPGGFENFATNNAFAAGTRARANHSGSFVWSDATTAGGGMPIGASSFGANTFTARATGGVRFYSTDFEIGVSLAPNGTSWTGISDRNAKKNFQPADSREILEKLAHMPIQRWNYKWEDDGAVPHLGPMAQDFKAAFYPGRDDKTISTLEADGVALAAIQGLNEKVELRSERAEGRIQQLQAENAELKTRLTVLEKLITKLNTKRNEP